MLLLVLGALAPDSLEQPTDLPSSARRAGAGYGFVTRV